MNGEIRDANQPLLDVRDLIVSYDGIRALQGVSFVVNQGEIVTLIGANGAGKTSILRAVSGLVSYNGSIRFEAQDLKRVPAHRIVALGIAQVPEGRGIFGNLTVLENLRLATWQRTDKGEIEADYQRVFQTFPRLKERQHQASGTLSGGEQQMLAVGRALMSRGRLLLLDEPSMGLAPRLVREIFRVIQDINQTGVTVLLVEQNANMALRIASRAYVLDEPSMGLSPRLVQDIFRIIQDINQAGITILLVEQNANMALRIASRAYVLETGSIMLSGTGSELLGDPRIKEAYLGA